MAPALTEPPPEPKVVNDPFEDSDAVQSTERKKPLDQHRRRAFVSVDNLSQMEEDDMGLQNTASLAKDSQEMDQILVDLGGGDLGQVDLFQAIKTMESGGDTLSTGETDAIFPLSGFDLAETADSEGDATEDKIRLLQARLERRCAFLQRRLRILQARTIGKRVSEEVVQTFERCTRVVRRDGGGRPTSTKTLIKRLDMTSTLQANAASRSIVRPKYFHTGTSSKGDATRSSCIGIPSGTFTNLSDTAGSLRSHLSVVKHELDSDATVSSSGAESNDEAVAYNNPHQHHMSIEKRALWSWQRARASIASRWSWLQAQVQELEYKIRQHTDLHAQVRQSKGSIQFEGEPMAYEGPLPGSSTSTDDIQSETCARVRPLIRETFKKRKLLQMHNLHTATAKAAKPADIRCGCQWPISGCAVCTGRAVATQPLPPYSTLAPTQRLALIDPGYHPVLSDIHDVSPSIHMAALSSKAWFRSRSTKPTRGSHHSSMAHHSQSSTAASKSTVEGKVITTKRKYNTSKLKRGRPRKVQIREPEEAPAPQERTWHRTSGSDSSRYVRVNSSYDIDNIVIPQSVAANTRPEILHYKEIITPKWRVIDLPEVPLNNGILKSSIRISLDSEEEDLSEEAILARHTRAEESERSRFTSKQRTRRSNHGNSTDSPHGEQDHHIDRSSIIDLSENTETVRPYSPRVFPLSEENYLSMLRDMPQGHPLNGAEEERQEQGGLTAEPYMDDETLSPLSPLIYDDGDPDDEEWDPSREKTKR